MDYIQRCHCNQSLKVWDKGSVSRLLSCVSSVCFSQSVTLPLQVDDEDDLDTRDQTDDDYEEDEDED